MLLIQSFEDKFVWNVEQAGAQRPFRIMQKRGVIVDAEDFVPITKTYPQHPLTSIQPKAINQQQLREQRKEKYRQDINEKLSAFQKHVKKVMPVLSKIPDEGYCESPQFCSVKQKQADKRVNERRVANLTDIGEDPKYAVGSPSLMYVRHPVNKTTNELVEARRQ